MRPGEACEDYVQQLYAYSTRDSGLEIGRPRKTSVWTLIYTYLDVFVYSRPIMVENETSQIYNIISGKSEEDDKHEQ